ncbi:MAG: 16S rRNA (guanine(966)-N(2))-methyltransferase RsmD [Candidatus Omnitrophica bacterium]|nr:16S rRNA (guanine(966)-N(2))-methyltransferase RsmD [Candidatus Omnitrophota bacterium]
MCSLKMRITTGKYKGRRLEMPKGIRPTQEKIRKAIFDILGDISDLLFLELFAGSGSVGIEALSRGAKEVVFVENNRECLKVLNKNLTAIKAFNQAILPLAVEAAVKGLAKDSRKFQIIFIDPPYYRELVPRLGSISLTTSRSGPMVSPVESLAKKTLQSLGAYDILAPNGFLVVQHSKKESLPAKLGVLNLIRQSKYADNLLSFYQKGK